MRCQWLVDGRCVVAGKIAERPVAPEEAACAACMSCSPPMSVNRVTVGLAAAWCANDGDGTLASEIMATHRAVVFADAKPYKIIPPKQSTPTHLVGDELTKLIAEYGLSAKSSCSCKSWAGRMNEWGIEGCSLHRDEIVSHLNEAYHAAKWWQKLQAAGNAVYHSLPLTLGGMVDEAIVRTRNSQSGN